MMMMRSKLFVPASRPEVYGKALASEADALSFDLEDAVAEPRKAEARAVLREFLRSPAAGASGKTLIVRVNARSTPHFVDDLRSVAWAGVHLVNLPKADNADDVRAAALALGAAERANGVAEPIGLLLNIESPGALRQAAVLAAADSRVAGLQLGLGDLFEPLGIDRRNASAVRQTMLLLRFAAGEAGVWACDSAFADLADADGFRAEAAVARSLGYVGKSCVHPKQVALANAAFRPTAAEVAHARRVVDSTARAAADGVGAWMVDGRMVDPPFVARARALLALAERSGVTP